MRFHVQFLERSANIVCEMRSSARNVAHVIEMLKAIDWPPAAVSLRILDRDGHQVHFLENSADFSYLTSFDRARPSRPNDQQSL
jgi:hypothetical protein